MTIFTRQNLDPEGERPAVRYWAKGADESVCAIGASEQGVILAPGVFPTMRRREDVEDLIMTIRLAYVHHRHLARGLKPLLTEVEARAEAELEAIRGR